MVCWVWVMLQVWLPLIVKGKDQVKLINNSLECGCGLSLVEGDYKRLNLDWPLPL